MTTYAQPALWSAAHLELVQVSNNMKFESLLNGAVQTGSLPGAKWGWNVTFPEQNSAIRQRIEGSLSRMSGNEHRVQMYDLARPAPLGTCNLTGVTVSGAVAQFALSMTLAGCGASKTLYAGDWFSVITAAGSQLLMVADDATANGSGVMSINFRQDLRAAVSSGTAVTLDKPTALYVVMTNPLMFPREAAGKCPEFSIQLSEVFS